MTALQHIRKNKPVIHCITNYVTANFQANALLALGASPIMADLADEVTEVTSFANALVLNFGTLQQHSELAMTRAGQKANERGIPVVIDPVGVGAIRSRLAMCQRLLQVVNPTAFRLNAGELAAIAGEQWEARGVDAGSGEANVEKMARFVAEKYDAIVVVTGATDLVVSAQQTFEITGGDPWMKQVTGAGCVLTTIVAAFATVKTDAETIQQGVRFYKKVAEHARQAATGIGQFQVECLNYLQMEEL